jgi:flavin-dependent dehydrogenase
MPPCFDFGAIDRGYGWVFPKDDHWNVGLYTIAKQTNLRHKLAEYIRMKGFRVSGDPLATFQAHRFPFGGYRIALPTAPVYIVGDAGGFGDPLLGEGIYHAIESGRIAGDAAADCLGGHATVGAYYERLKPGVLTDTLITYYASRLFYRDVDRGLAILENPFIWRPFFEGGADGASFSRSLARAWWLLPKSVVRPRFLHRRTGRSQSFALGGPLRGLAYLCAALIDRADWLSGPIP